MTESLADLCKGEQACYQHFGFSPVIRDPAMKGNRLNGFGL
jgi:hypothetical protein